MGTNRINRISEEVKRELSGIIRELKDPRIPVMTSVVVADVTNDLRYAKAYVSVLGSEEEKKEALAALKKAAGFMRHEIAQRLDLRYAPELIFHLDSSIEHGAYINQLIRETHKE
jgi:ribosome-binding factor A